MLAAIVAAGFALALLALVGGGVFGWYVYARIAADLPTVDGLRTYAPPEMSRVYAGNQAMIAELGPQRPHLRAVLGDPEAGGAGLRLGRGQELLDQWRHRPDGDRARRRDRRDAARPGPAADRRLDDHAAGRAQHAAELRQALDHAQDPRGDPGDAPGGARCPSSASSSSISTTSIWAQGTYGVAAAAQTYFNLPLDQLDTAQAAFLGGLPKAPNYYDPAKHPDAARARRDWVIDRMREDGAITSAQASAAKAEPLAPAKYKKPAPIPGSAWFADEVRRQLIDKFGEQTALEGGLTVQTSLDPALQAAAETVAARRADALRPARRKLARAGHASRLGPGAARRGLVAGAGGGRAPAGDAAALDAGGGAARGGRGLSDGVAAARVGRRGAGRAAPARCSRPMTRGYGSCGWATW